MKKKKNHRIEDEEFIKHIHDTEIINKAIFGHVRIDEDLRLYTKKKKSEICFYLKSRCRIFYYQKTKD